jgi:hypothetical protein
LSRKIVVDKPLHLSVGHNAVPEWAGCQTLDVGWRWRREIATDGATGEKSQQAETELR